MTAIFTGLGAGFERGSGSVVGSGGLLGSSALGRGGDQLFLNAATGNLLINRNDEFLVGMGPDASISRTYNSLGNLPDDNNDHWRQSTDRRIVNAPSWGTYGTTGTTVQRVSGDGSLITYTWQSIGGVAAYWTTDGAGAYDKLTSDGTNWTWTDGDTHATETYEASGDYYRIKTQVDVDDNTVTFSYDGAGKLYRVLTADGLTGAKSYLQYNWDGSNNIAAIVTGYVDDFTTPGSPVDKTQTRTTYSYNAGRLETVTVDLTPENGADNVTYTTTYTYKSDTSGNAGFNLISRIYQSDHSQVDVTYDTSNRVQQLIQTTSTGVTRSQTIAYLSDTDGNYTTVTDDQLGATVRLDYNINGSLKKVTMPPATGGAAAQITEFGYDPSGRGDFLTVKDALGNTTSFTYDIRGNLATTTDRTNNVVTRSYDASNRLLSVTSTGSDKGSPSGTHVVRYFYADDPATTIPTKHLRFTVSAEGDVTEYTYTPTGQLKQVIQYTKDAFTGALDPAHDIALVQLDGWRLSRVGTTDIALTENDYNGRGELKSTKSYASATLSATQGAVGSATDVFVGSYSTYDQAGRLRLRNTQDRAQEVFLYDGLDRLTSALDVNGGTTTYNFQDASGQTIVSFASGLIQTSTYNLAGELTSFTESKSASGPAMTVAADTANYTYDAAGRLRKLVDATGKASYFLYDEVGRKVADISGAGDVIEYKYDAGNRLVATVRYATRLTSTQLTQMNIDSAADLAYYRPTGLAGDLWSWNIYDKDGRLVQAIAGDGSTTIYGFVDSSGNFVSGYDGSGRLVFSTSYFNRLTAGTLAGLKTNPPAAVTAATAPAADSARDRVSRTFYDKDGRLLGALDGEGFITEPTYDAAGRKVLEKAYVNATTANRATGTFQQILDGTAAQADDRITRYAYDGKGQLRFVIDANFQVTETLYDQAGQATTSIAYANAISSGTSDFRYANIKSLATSLTVGRRGWSIYDSAGRVAFAIDEVDRLVAGVPTPSGRVTAYSYNESGQVTKLVQFAALRTTLTPIDKASLDSWAAANASPTADRVTRNYYDGVGDLRLVIDGENYVIRRTEDAEDRLVKVERFPLAIPEANTTGADAVNNWVNASGGVAATTLNDYDTLGRLQSVTDAEGVVHRFEYDPNGLLVRDIASYGTTDISTTYFVYDGAGRVLEQHRGYGATEVSIAKFTYDGLGNALTIIDPNNKVTTQTFDRLGQVLTSTNALGGVTTYSYDAYGNAVSVKDVLNHYSYSYYNNLNQLISTRDAENYVTETSYNVYGEVTSVTRRYGKATNPVTQVPAPTPNAKDAVTSFEYDKLGRVTKTTDAEGYYEAYTLNAFGDRVSVRNKLAGTITNIFDRRGLLISEILPMNSVTNAGTVQANTVTNTFAYDSRGNRTQMVEASGLTEARTINYTYDKLDRLTSKAIQGLTALSQTDFLTMVAASGESYAYDKRGNLIQVTDALGGRTVSYYDDLDRKIGEVGSLGTLRRWTYDAAGNRLTEKVGGDVVAVPTLPLTTPPTINGANYRETVSTYDNLGRLATTSVANVLIGTWDGSSGISPTTQNITTSLTYDAAGNVILTIDANGGWTWAYFDNLGRKTAQVDAERYLTSWTFDSETNALTERRYSTKWSSSISTVSPPKVATHANDRVTNFAYDRNGHRLTETRTGVVAWIANTSNGAVTQTATDATVAYTYNGLGQVTSKTEATGDRMVYSYDLTGRLIVEHGAAFTDHTNTTVQRHLVNHYNGLNDLVRSEQGGTLNPATLVSSDWTVVGSGDFNGDGRDDALWRHRDGTIANWLGTASGGWIDNGSNSGSPAGLDWNVAGTGDFNGDGRDDILWRNNNGELGNWFGTAAGGFVVNSSYAATVSTDWKVVGTGDFNGDGRDDILWRNDGGQLTDWLATYSGGFVGNDVNAFFNIPISWRTAGVGDFNGDGRDDILWRNADGQFSNWLGQANGGFIPNDANAATTVPIDWQIAGTGDFNGDGRDDVLWRNTAGQLSNWLGQANGGFVGNDANAFANVPTSWNVASTGDVNGDGRDDIIWRDTSGLFKTWLANANGGYAIGTLAEPRIATYAYGAGGRLNSVTDAAGGIHNYAYDAAGNVLRDSYTRVKSDATSANEGILYTRDILGRVTAQAIATNNGSAWVRGDSQNSEYNAYGEIGRRGLNGMWQETFTYDNAGRLIKNNSGDGVWRFLIYDANGNKTLTIESEGTDLSALTQAQALALARPGGVAAGSAFVDGINLGITIYDKRNMATSSVLPQRELSAAGARVSVITSQTYNAFGEVASQTDARLNTTNFTYNSMGRLIEKKSPLTNWTNESGVVASAQPIETYYYDLGGRLIGSRDPNGNLTSRTLLAGTGYGDAEAMVAAEYHADTGIARTFYDVFGDARTARNELNIDETRTYDAMGRLLTQVHRGALLTDNYTYDLLGQRITHWNSFLGSLNKETTDYDLQGRVVKAVAFGGDITTTSYVWDGNLVTTGMATFGGWTQTDTYANSRTMTVATDMFGRDLSKTDMGGHSFTFGYDKAGRQLTRTTAGETQTTTWLNSGLAAQISLTASDYGNYTYDAAGNRLSEYTVRGGVVAQNATATYDTLGRLITWNEAGSTATPLASKIVEYDLNGNIRRNNGTYRTVNDNGVIATVDTVKDMWFRYDAMNRVTLDDGSFANGVIANGVGTHTMQYNVAGQRTSATTMGTGSREVLDPNGYYDPYDGTWYGGYWYEYFETRHREEFVYANDGTLITVKAADQTATYDENGVPVDDFAMPAGLVKASFTYDAMGRLTRQQDWIADGTNAGYDRAITYNAKGQNTYEVIARKQWDGDSWDNYTDYNTYNFGTGAGYALGAVLSMATDAYRFGNDSDAKDTSSGTTYDWYDGAVLATQTFDRDTNSSSNALKVSTFTNSGSGIASLVTITDDASRRVKFTTDMSGEVLIRDEDKRGTYGIYQSLGPTDVWHRFNGREMNYTSNNAGSTAPMDYVTSANKRTAKPSSTTTGMFAGGAATTGWAHGDVDSSYEGVNSFKQGSGGSRYTVRGGETLQSIAQNVWGDSSYWYKIAEANGLSADAALVDGQALSLPAGVTRSTNNASTFKPYDASEAIGDTAPTRIKPPKAKKAGLFGMILLAVIAIAVTVITAGAALAAIAPGIGTIGAGISAVMAGSAVGVGAGAFAVAGAIGGAIGSIVSQGFGVATGLQDKFSWKAVAIAGIAGGIGGGIGALGKGGLFGARGADGILVKGALGKVGSSVVRAGLNGIVSNTLTQGISVATGLQPKFDWAGVAAAGIGAGVGAAAGGKLGNVASTGLRRGITGGASLIANAATRSLIDGSDFGDNILAGLPDVIAQTLGGFVEDGVAARSNEGDETSKHKVAQSDARSTDAGAETDAQFLQQDQLSWNIESISDETTPIVRDAIYRTIDGVPIDEVGFPFVTSALAADFSASSFSKADLIVASATGFYGSQNWADAATWADPFSGIAYGPGNKCSIFVGYVLETAGVSPGRPNFGLFKTPFEVGSPPTAGQWADTTYVINGWRILRGNDAPRPGDVVAQSIGYADASGHVGIVGPRDTQGRLTFVGTGSQAPTNRNGSWDRRGTFGPHGAIEVIPMPSTLTGGANVRSGPLVYRRWNGTGR